MIALVTGATGYVGHMLANYLVAHGWEVHALVRSGSQITRLAARIHKQLYDITELGNVRRIVGHVQPDVIFHLAAQVSLPKNDDVGSLVDANVKLGTQLLDAMSTSGRRMIAFADTYWSYGENKTNLPNTVYAATKVAFRQIAQYYCERRNIQAVGLVLYDVYGPNDWREKLLPRLIRAARKQESLAATEGTQLVDMVHVHDAVNAFVVASELLRDKALPNYSNYAIRTGRLITVRDLVAVVESVIGCRVPICWGQRPYTSEQIMKPSIELPILPSWRAQISLEDGLQSIVNYNGQK